MAKAAAQRRAPPGQDRGGRLGSGALTVPLRQEQFYISETAGRSRSVMGHRCQAHAAGWRASRSPAAGTRPAGPGHPPRGRWHRSRPGGPRLGQLSLLAGRLPQVIAPDPGRHHDRQPRLGHPPYPAPDRQILNDGDISRLGKRTAAPVRSETLAIAASLPTVMPSVPRLKAALAATPPAWGPPNDIDRVAVQAQNR
jgi:hypothetical protein